MYIHTCVFSYIDLRRSVHIGGCRPQFQTTMTCVCTMYVYTYMCIFIYRFEKERAHWRMQASDQDHHDLRTLTWRSRKTLQVVAERDKARSRVSELEGHLSSLSVHFEHEHSMNTLSVHTEHPMNTLCVHNEQSLETSSLQGTPYEHPQLAASSLQGKRETGAHFLKSPLYSDFIQ
jgi:predicted Fe-S protein YdhL (DUF1289 family)